MPLYQFECKKCGHTFEFMLSLKEADQFNKSKGDCPECKGKKTVSKVISPVSFIVNGYCNETGYAKKRKSK